MIVVDSTPQMRNKLVEELSSQPFFSGLQAAARSFLSERISILRYLRGERVFSQGEPADAYYFVLKGSGKLELEEEKGLGGIQISIVSKMQGMGGREILTGRSYPLSLIATEVMLVIRIKKEVLMELFEQDAAFGIHISKLLATRLVQQLPRIPLEPYDGSQPIDPAAMMLLPLSFLKRHCVLPLYSKGSQLTMGFVEEMSVPLLQRVKTFLPSMEVVPLSITASLFHSTLRDMEQQKETEATPKDTTAVASPDILMALLHRVIAEGASDLHLTTGLKPRWRIDGEMQEIGDFSSIDESLAEWLKPFMREDIRMEFERDKDTDFAIQLDDVARFRVNLFCDHNGIGAVFRLIPSKILSIQQLGLPNVLLKLAAHPKGLVLVTGPTGSGKSTTLAAMIDFVNRTRSEHIITLEDPIEFVHRSKNCLVNQREIGSHSKSFTRALRAALRQDPDIVLVGELRDLETIQLAIEVANTGHLVFGTLHTSTAVTTVDRIVDMFPAIQQNQIRNTLSEVLIGVVSQTLCKKRGGGRIAAIEVLVLNAASSNLIREGRTSQLATVMQTGKAQGNCMLNDSLAALVNQKKILYEEALKKTIDKADLARRLKKVYTP
ncbi:MAG: PilT/PilU family type 4a pilus ATPase [Myxococcota bacterium]|nr:PilT/PilU family type 4a pilus ATPase [Myxococcota bacterium]